MDELEIPQYPIIEIDENGFFYMGNPDLTVNDMGSETEFFN